MIRHVHLFALVLCLISACGSNNPRQEEIKYRPLRELFPPDAAAQGAEQPAAAPAPQPARPSAPEPVTPPRQVTRWPVSFTADKVSFEVHEPIADLWRDDQMVMHALVLARTSGQKQPEPGSVLMRATAEADGAAGVVALHGLQVVDARFQSPAMTKAWTQLLATGLPGKIATLQLARLESGPPTHTRDAGDANNAPAVPRIVISQKPAVLVYIDGEPKYVALRSGNLMGVINTRVLLLKNPVGMHYLHLYNGWVSAKSLQGPWSVARAPSGAGKLEQAARESGRVDLLPGKPDAKGRSPTLSQQALPHIIVSTSPAALVVVDGAPTFTAIAGTTLQYATNTSAHLFRDLETKRFYVRVGGNWFRAAAAAGPWEYVPVSQLPAGFLAIPDDSPKRDVKRAIAASRNDATPSAPNVVAVKPNAARLSMTVDGDPILQPIAGTQLNFVANASVPVIQVDINNWYAVQNGVWFHAGTAFGPWTATDSIPPAIYAIPPSAPMYHAIHSHVLASSGDLIYYGYSPFGAGAVGVEDQGADYQYTPPSGLYWGWVY